MLLVLEGQRPGWISEVLGQTRMNVNRWTRAVNKDGVEALIPKKQPGRLARMTPKIEAQLELHLKESPQKFGLNRVRWDGPTLATHLQRHFGVKLKVRQAQYWMHRLGYRLKRASHVYLPAKAEDAKRFAKGLKKLETLGPKETVVFQDESVFTLHPRLGRGWALIGKRLKVPTTSQHQKRWMLPAGLLLFLVVLG